MRGRVHRLDLGLGGRHRAQRHEFVEQAGDRDQVDQSALRRWRLDVVHGLDPRTDAGGQRAAADAGVVPGIALVEDPAGTPGGRGHDAVTSRQPPGRVRMRVSGHDETATTTGRRARTVKESPGLSFFGPKGS